MKVKRNSKKGSKVVLVREPSQRKRNKKVTARMYGDRELVNNFGPVGPLALSSSNKGQGRKSHLIVEDEYIGEVFSSVSFATTQYPINMGQNTTFPWGSKIASLYEKYCFESLEFYYRREVSEFSTNGQTGKIMLSVDFDASDPPPINKQQVEDTEPHADAMPCTEYISLKLDPRDLQRLSSLYVRAGAQPTSTDIKTYDVGNLFVSTQGLATGGVSVGELRVRYRCRVMTPVLENPTLSLLPGSTFTMIANSLGEQAGATTTYVSVFQTVEEEAVAPVILSNGIGADVGDDGGISVPNGVYLISATSTTAAEAANVTNAYIFASQTASNGFIISTEASGSQNAGNNVWPFKACSSNTGPFYFDTAIYGNFIYFLVVASYDAGAPFNYSQCTITYLSNSTTKLH